MNSPRSFDVVLGGEQAGSYAAVLGGWLGIKQRWEVGTPQERAALLAEALRFGAEGLALVQQATTDSSPLVRRRALQLLWTAEQRDGYWLMDNLGTLRGHTKAVSGVILNRQGSAIISCGYDRTIRLWDRATQQMVNKLKDHSDLVTGIALSPDQETLVSSSRDRTVKIWHLPTGELRQTLTGHYGYVNSVAISPDGETIVTGSQDSTIKLWHLPTGAEIRTIKAHTNLVNAVPSVPTAKRSSVAVGTP